MGSRPWRFAPTDGNTVYAGNDRGKVQSTINALDGSGAVWVDRTAGLPGRAVTHIAVNPLNPATALCHVPRASLDRSPRRLQVTSIRRRTTAPTWQNITGNLPAIPVSDPGDRSGPAGYAVHRHRYRVKMTTDGGSTWTTLGNGLTNVAAVALSLHRRARVLRAGTHGRGVVGYCAAHFRGPAWRRVSITSRRRRRMRSWRVHARGERLGLCGGVR